MFIDDLEFMCISKKLNIEWREIVDKDIKPGKMYLISDKKFEYGNKEINVVEKLAGKYRQVATRCVRQGDTYLVFDVASHVRKKRLKQMLLHRARLIAFKGVNPDKPIGRHGEAGSDNHDLCNLSWGTHDENMDDARRSGSHRGKNNASSKITEELALSIYILSKLDLITPEIIECLPVGKGIVAAIKAKRNWSHVVSEDINFIVNLCEKVNREKYEVKIEAERVKMEKENYKNLKLLNKSFKDKLQRLLSEI